MLLAGRVAVVTGGGRGIGRAYALCFAQEGASVVVDDVGASLDGREVQGDPASDVCEEIRAMGGKAVAVHESVAHFEAAGRIVEAALQEFGRLDILVNNAGIMRNGPLLTMTEDDFDAVVDVHLKGTFNVSRHAAPVMKDQGYGRIINITSGGGLQGRKAFTNYGAAKAGVMGLTFVWALELAPFGITVNALAPSAETRMTAPAMVRKGVSGKPKVQADGNAPLVAYLASERAGQVNGQIFGRTGLGYSLFQSPKQIASMWAPGWTPAKVATNFAQAFGPHLQPVGRAGTRFNNRRDNSTEGDG
jgi:NAD(P)-dependent dehydrogenase (short-subunit alcohol dehydrogenase family)